MRSVISSCPHFLGMKSASHFLIILRSILALSKIIPRTGSNLDVVLSFLAVVDAVVVVVVVDDDDVAVVVGGGEGGSGGYGRGCGAAAGALVATLGSIRNI